MSADQRLSASLWEADRHAAALGDALTDWAPVSTLGLHEIEQDRLHLCLVDQLLFRFTKLQDALGERLIPATLAQLAEPFEDWPMRDRLNRLEKLGYLNADDWLRWRAVRNRLAHEYPDAPELRLASLRGGIQAARELLHAYAHWRSQLAQPKLLVTLSE